MTRKLLVAAVLPLLSACGSPGTADENGGALTELESDRGQAGAVAPGSVQVAGDATEIAVLPYGDGHVVFTEAPDGSVIAYGRTPIGGARMPPDLFAQGVAELYRELAPGAEVPEALLRAERVQQELAELSIAEGEPPVELEPVQAGLLESEGLEPRYQAPAGEAFGAWEAWFEDNYCGFSQPDVDVCVLGRTTSTNTTFTNTNITANYLAVEAGGVARSLKRGTTTLFSGTFAAGYVYGPAFHSEGYIDYLVYVYWKTATLKWQFSPLIDTLFHYSGWADSNGATFIDPPG